jgi:tRNA A-37 threonylcarbamoyl transferase component Bud32
MNQYQQFFLYNKLAYKNMFKEEPKESISTSTHKNQPQPPKQPQPHQPPQPPRQPKQPQPHQPPQPPRQPQQPQQPQPPQPPRQPQKHQQKNTLEPEKSKKAIESVHVSSLTDFDMIRQKNNELFLAMSNFKTKEEILRYLGSLKDIHQFTSIHTNSDKVSLIEGFIVKKVCLNNSLGNYMFTNEINALSKLRGYPHFPHLIAYDPNSLIIYMTYCGNLLSSENLPSNWREQVHEIKEIMTGLNINSNDMLLRNTCCFDGEIKIIDFGLHTIFGRTINEVISDLHNNINILSSSKTKGDNITNKYKYMDEYPNWKNNLEKYKQKQILIKKAQEDMKKYIKQQIHSKKK